VSTTLGHWFTCSSAAQQRLGQAEASTTLRQCCHPLPLDDQDVADHLDGLLDSVMQMEAIPCGRALMALSGC
jgi:hypothetical protein